MKKFNLETIQDGVSHLGFFPNLVNEFNPTGLLMFTILAEGIFVCLWECYGAMGEGCYVNKIVDIAPLEYIELSELRG